MLLGETLCLTEVCSIFYKKEIRKCYFLPDFVNLLLTARSGRAKTNGMRKDLKKICKQNIREWLLWTNVLTGKFC